MLALEQQPLVRRGVDRGRKDYLGRRLEYGREWDAMVISRSSWEQGSGAFLEGF